MKKAIPFINLILLFGAILFQAFVIYTLFNWLVHPHFPTFSPSKWQLYGIALFVSFVTKNYRDQYTIDRLYNAVCTTEPIDVIKLTITVYYLIPAAALLTGYIVTKL